MIRCMLLTEVYYFNWLGSFNMFLHWCHIHSLNQYCFIFLKWKQKDHVYFVINTCSEDNHALPEQHGLSANMFNNFFRWKEAEWCFIVDEKRQSYNLITRITRLTSSRPMEFGTVSWVKLGKSELPRTHASPKFAYLVLRNGHGQGDLLKFKRSIRIGKKGDLSAVMDKVHIIYCTWIKVLSSLLLFNFTPVKVQTYLSFNILEYWK